MIGMTVGINNMGYPVLLLLGFGQNVISFKGRIYQGASFCVFVANQITEHGHPGQPYLLNFHNGFSIPNKLTIVPGRLNFTATVQV